MDGHFAHQELQQEPWCERWLDGILLARTIDWNRVMHVCWKSKIHSNYECPIILVHICRVVELISGLHSWKHAGVQDAWETGYNIVYGMKGSSEVIIGL